MCVACVMARCYCCVLVAVRGLLLLCYVYELLSLLSAVLICCCCLLWFVVVRGCSLLCAVVVLPLCGVAC